MTPSNLPADPIPATKSPLATPHPKDASPSMTGALPALRKVPEITVFFWILKLLTTAMGEVTSDFLVHQFNPYFAVALGTSVFVIALVLQFLVHRYIAWVYWFAVVMVAVFGTMAADVLHVEFGIPYLVTTVSFAAALVMIFVAWYATEKTLSIHSINTHRRELFYWATVMATFALGTATGDMTSITLHLGYLASGVMFAILICLPALAYWLFHLNEIVAFWIAYILTRPLGATFADWVGKPKSVSGLGLGTGWVSLTLTTLIVLLVIYLTITRRDVKDEHTGPSAPHPQG
jgi:uncharacterized membrane-anchored protein